MLKCVIGNNEKTPPNEGVSVSLVRYVNKAYKLYVNSASLPFDLW
jgi:hypothetical protein